MNFWNNFINAIVLNRPANQYSETHQKINEYKTSKKEANSAAHETEMLETNTLLSKSNM